MIKLRTMIDENLNEAKLVDDVYEALSMHIKGFDKLGMDEQGEITMKVEKILKSAGLK